MRHKREDFSIVHSPPSVHSVVKIAPHQENEAALRSLEGYTTKERELDYAEKKAGLRSLA